MPEDRKRATLAGTTLEHSCHACAFFHSTEEEYSVMLPFMLEGLQSRDKALHIIDPARRQERMQRLAALPFDCAAAESSGQIEVRAWEDAYLRMGHFDKYAMLNLIESVLKSGKEAGYPLTRLWANMEWALTDLPGVHDIIEYEARLNQILPQYDDVVVCAYDLNRFSATVVMDIMRTHPMVLIGGILHANPYYVPPEQFLEELARRGGTNSQVSEGSVQ
ncbi:MAG: sensory transduction histidine kinase [Bryobacterales bacterium]|nr:sensory transduction histidine kinase [Bryobacterales bacterium]